MNKAAARASEVSENHVSNLDSKSENEKDAAGLTSELDPVKFSCNQSDDESVEFEINAEDGDAALQLQLETPELKTASPIAEEEKELAKSPAGDDELTDDRLLQLLSSLTEEQSKAREHNAVFQSKLVKVFQETTADGQQDEEVAKWNHAKNLGLLADMKQQQAAELEKIEQLSISQSVLQDRLDEVKHEWQSLLAHQQEVAMTVLSRRLSKEASQAQVSSAVKHQEDLEERVIQQCRDNIRLKIVNETLEAKLRDEEVRLFSVAKNQVEKLMANRLQTTQLGDHQREKWSELEKKVCTSVEVLSNLKEKIHWTQEEMQAKQSRLVQLEATLVHKRTLLTKARQACYHLNEDKAKLKERHVLQGSMLVQDYNDTLEDCQRLEGSLEKLKTRWAELNNSH
ncbi:cilia- and flagella-associated protein 184 [Neosynchiropus ocellatus]